MTLEQAYCSRINDLCQMALRTQLRSLDGTALSACDALLTQVVWEHWTVRLTHRQVIPDAHHERTWSRTALYQRACSAMQCALICTMMHVAQDPLVRLHVATGTCLIGHTQQHVHFAMTRDATAPTPGPVVDANVLAAHLGGSVAVTPNDIFYAFHDAREIDHFIVIETCYNRDTDTPADHVWALRNHVEQTLETEFDAWRAMRTTACCILTQGARVVWIFGAPSP